MPLYAATITLGALLLFLVQPLLSRAILPWFGGSAAVWTTSLAFFQTALLLGYALVHLGLARLKPRAQVLAVFALLAACVPFLPIAPDPAARPTHADPRGSDVLRVLVATVLRSRSSRGSGRPRRSACGRSRSSATACCSRSRRGARASSTRPRSNRRAHSWLRDLARATSCSGSDVRRSPRCC
ncbi:MAG: hypothetical protein IPH13_00550 [Planctomycetes bacterium]|nr:hypothetical protein [Planctomycetota bacterium]